MNEARRGLRDGFVVCGSTGDISADEAHGLPRHLSQHVGGFVIANTLAITVAQRTRELGLLRMVGAGPYRVVGLKTIQEAMLTAARAMRRTGRPVGLLVWRGCHAWVMSGFRATRDPLLPGAKVTGAIVEDPLYPYGGSTVWGPSPAPGSTLSIRALGRQFVPRRRSSRLSSLAGKYVLVLPFEFAKRVPRRD